MNVHLDLSKRLGVSVPLDDETVQRVIRIPLLGLLLFLIGAWYPHSARADWSLAGAQYMCDGKSNVFEVVPYDRSSDDPPDGVPVQPGFKEITADHPSIICRIGGHTLRATILVLSPGNGQCEGAGLVRAESVSVSGVELLPDRPVLDWACDASSVPLIKIRVTLRQAALILERCTTTIGSAPQEHCETKEINVDAVAAATAKQNHDLADLATQESQSATKLPSDNNLATVFRPSDPGPDAIPACAHWRSGFLRNIGLLINLGGDAFTNGPIPHGRIAGRAGDRVYLLPANPQVCDMALEPLCRPKAYVIPGDRVDVGFICGAWTFVRYPARLASSTNIFGWIPTVKLYAVDSLVSVDPKIRIAIQQRAAKYPLLSAIATDDFDRVRELLAAGADPNGPFDGQPLRDAIHRQNFPIVQALVVAGAKPNAKALQATCSFVAYDALLTTDEIFAALIKSGLDLKCVPGPLQMVAGASRVDALDGDVSNMGIWTPIRDLPAMVERLLKQGIPVDSALKSGRTALFAAVRENNVDVARVLLNAGAKPNVVMHDAEDSSDAAFGATPLLQALSTYQAYLDPTMVKILLDGGANPNLKSAGEYLNEKQDAGDIPRATNPLAGVTALHVTAELGYLSLTKALLDHGADPHIPRSDGALPADIARQNGHPAVSALIEEYLGRH